MGHLMAGERITWQNANGFFSPEEAAELQRLSTRRICLEIGSFYGKSTVCMAEVAMEVHAVDTWKVDGDGQTQLAEINETIFKTFLHTITGYTNIFTHIGKSAEQVPPLADNYFDLVFIDATHTYEGVMEDVAVSFPKLKYNGVFVFHDYGTWNEVTSAVDFLFERKSHPIMSLIYGYKYDLRGR